MERTKVEGLQSPNYAAAAMTHLHGHLCRVAQDQGLVGDRAEDVG